MTIITHHESVVSTLKPISRCGKCDLCTYPRPCVICAEPFAPHSHDPFFMRVCLPCLERAVAKGADRPRLGCHCPDCMDRLPAAPREVTL